MRGPWPMLAYRVRYVGGPGEISQKYIDIIHKLQVKTFEGEDVASKRRKKAECHWWVVYADGEPVGFGGLQLFNYFKPKFGFIFLTGVLKEHQGKGIKKKIVRCMEKKLRSLGITRLVSYASYWNLPSANSLLSMGYKLYKPSDPDWGMKGAYFLRKEL